MEHLFQKRGILIYSPPILQSFILGERIFLIQSIIFPRIGKIAGTFSNGWKTPYYTKLIFLNLQGSMLRNSPTSIFHTGVPYPEVAPAHLITSWLFPCYFQTD